MNSEFNQSKTHGWGGVLHFWVSLKTFYKEKIKKKYIYCNGKTYDMWIDPSNLLIAYGDFFIL